MNTTIRTLISCVIDPAAVRVQKTIARARTRKPQPWLCRHNWQRCHVAVTGQPGRYCPRCTTLEPLHGGQPPRHPESMAILLPLAEEKTLEAIDEVLWPGEVL